MNQESQQFQNNFNNINQNNNFFQANNQSQQINSNTFQQTINQSKAIENHKSHKKVSLIAGIIATIITIIIAITTIVIINSKSSKNDNNLDSNKFKEQIYLNNNKNINDKLSFILNSIMDEKNVFLGFSLKDISKPLTGDIISLNNEMTRLQTANMKIQFSYNHNSYSIDTDVVGYQTKNNKTTEYIDDKNIIYKNNNYYIIPSNIDSYILYYKYDERPWYGNNDETEATWYVLNFGLYKTLEAAFD